MGGEYLLAVLVYLYLADALMAGQLEPEVKASDSCEEGHELHELMSFTCIVDGVYSIHNAV